jgi:hypothetical protein
MVPRPVALGLTLCESVIIEEGTKNVSLINCFTGLKVAGFPSTPRPFCVLAALMDGKGDGTIDVMLTRLDSDDVVYELRRRAHFPDRLTEVRVLFRINECSFPAPGWYDVTLLVDGEWVAQRRVRVYSEEDQI